MRKELIAHEDPKSPISEVFRTLRTNIQFMSANKKLKTLLVTSTFPGEGKSLTSSNLAIAFAQTGKKVILIDADMRRGRQYAIFGVSPRPGLSNYLSGISEIGQKDSDDIKGYVQKTEIENLSLMSAGNVPPNPSELLVSTKMTKLLEKLGKAYDLVIIDGTPCELVTDSVILSRIVDSTVIVTAYKITKKDALERVIKNIKNVGGNLAGIVLNKVPVSQKKYSETYYYASLTEQTKKSNLKSKLFRKLSKNKKKKDSLKVSLEENNLDSLPPKPEASEEKEKIVKVEKEAKTKSKTKTEKNETLKVEKDSTRKKTGTGTNTKKTTTSNTSKKSTSSKGKK